MTEDQAFAAAEKVIKSMVKSFLAHYRVDPDEAWSEACMGFVRAVRSYDPDRGAELTSWVGTKVKLALMSLLRKKVEDARRTEPLVGDPPDPRGEAFDAEFFLSALSQDAATPVKAVFRTPIDVKVGMAEMGGESPVNFRTALRIFLKECGWPAARVDRAFAEVRSKL